MAIDNDLLIPTPIEVLEKRILENLIARNSKKVP
jgi:hypothetical protein